MSYATNADLVALRADINDDVADWSAQLALASADVLELIKTDWWQDAIRNNGFNIPVNRLSEVISAFDVAYLNTALLKNLTCYRALAFYIYPNLTKDTDDGNDAFSRRMQRYTEFFREEWERVKKMPLYDFSKDGTFQDWERADYVRTVKVLRA